MSITLETYLAYVGTVLIFFAHPPGPGQLLFMAHSLKAGVGKAVPVIAGNHSANVIQMLLAGFGLAGAIAASAEVFVVVKWLGVVYLLWLGVRTVLRAGGGPSAGRDERGSSLFRQGFVTAAANPYAVLFFAALFPQFLDPGAALLPQIAVFGATYLAIDAVILVAMGASAARISRKIGGRAMTVIDRVSGALMIGAAVLLATRDLSPGQTR